MSRYPDTIAKNIKNHIESKNPEILQYIDNHYVNELLNLLIEGISIEIANCLTEDKLNEIMRDAIRRI